MNTDNQSLKDETLRNSLVDPESEELTDEQLSVIYGAAHRTGAGDTDTLGGGQY